MNVCMYVKISSYIILIILSSCTFYEKNVVKQIMVVMMTIMLMIIVMVMIVIMMKMMITMIRTAGLVEISCTPMDS
jgi:hypothetical protein